MRGRIERAERGRHEARAGHRAAEARERHGLPDPGERPVQTASEWRYAGKGYTSGEAILAADIRERVQTSRHLQAQKDGQKDAHNDAA